MVYISAPRRAPLLPIVTVVTVGFTSVATMTGEHQNTPSNSNSAKDIRRTNTTQRMSDVVSFNGLLYAAFVPESENTPIQQQVSCRSHRTGSIMLTFSRCANVCKIWPTPWLRMTAPRTESSSCKCISQTLRETLQGSMKRGILFGL